MILLLPYVTPSVLVSVSCVDDPDFGNLRFVSALQHVGQGVAINIFQVVVLRRAFDGWQGQLASESQIVHLLFFIITDLISE